MQVVFLTDLIEVEDSVFSEFSATPPEGKLRGIGSDGFPIWVDIPIVESPEQIQARAVLCGMVIVSTDRMLVSDYTINNVLLTSEQQAELLDVRQKSLKFGLNVRDGRTWRCLRYLNGFSLRQ